MDPNLFAKVRRLNNNLSELSWETFRTFGETLLSSIDLDESRVLLSLVKSERWDEVIEYADYLASTEYPTPTKHRLCNQVASIFRKYPYPAGVVSYAPRAKALETFMASEHKCSRVNKRFLLYRTLRSPHESVLSLARSWIEYVLGELHLPDVFEACDFGAGASLGIHGNATNSARKLLSERWTVTPGAYYYARSFMKNDWHILESQLERRGESAVCVDLEGFNSSFDRRACIVNNNKISFVPKTAKTDRTIAVEPLLNGYLQKGVDVYLRKRLLRVGIDLGDQGRNQELARQGSLHWRSPDAWTTLDLSSASDSISTEFCRFMLPPEWFRLLDAIRSHEYELDGAKFRYHKFVSMGNGFCFPLETLLFASLCHAADVVSNTRGGFLVYGDDILIRKPAFATLLNLLKVCGFKVNTKKTFSEGPFRESCGADWYEGEDVRPVILDYAFDSIEAIFKFCNVARHKSSRLVLREGTDYLRTLIPPEVRFFRPFKGNDDSALEVEFDVFMASPFARFAIGTQTWSWMELVNEAVSDTFVRRLAGYNVALLRSALNGASSSAPFTKRYETRTKTRRITSSPGPCTDTTFAWSWYRSKGLGQWIKPTSV